MIFVSCQLVLTYKQRHCVRLSKLLVQRC